MLTEFGKFTRKLRIDINETLYQMAKRLNVSSSFLSAVEVGNKNIPKTWLELLSNEYKLSEDQKNDLKNAIELSTNVIKLDFSNKRIEDRELMLKLAKRISDFSVETKEKLNEILKGE